MSSAIDRPWQQDLKASATKLAAGAWAGLLAGFVIGGIGGRLAMFLLRLTSDPSLHGRETDDGFIIGSFTADTGFLVLVATAIGLLAGIAYLLLRNFMPERRRVVLTALLGGTFGGAVIIRPGGIDFTNLDPLTLAVALFIALPALQGAATAYLTERFLARAETRLRKSWILVIVALLPLALVGPFGLAILAAGLVGWGASRKVDLARMIDQRGVQRIGQIGLLALGAWFFYALVGDLLDVF